MASFLIFKEQSTVYKRITQSPPLFMRYYFPNYPLARYGSAVVGEGSFWGVFLDQGGISVDHLFDYVFFS